MLANTKNANDPWLRFRVTDIEGTGYLAKYILVEWVSDPAQFADLGLRSPDTAWPYDALSEALALTYVTNVPVYIYVPEGSWIALSRFRALYYRLLYGATPYVDASWVASEPRLLIVNHPPIASAGEPRVFLLGTDSLLTSSFQLDASASFDTDMSAALGDLRDPGPLSMQWALKSSPPGASALSLNLGTGDASPVVLATGTSIPADARGEYVFEVTLQDTDLPLSTSSPGISKDTVRHLVQGTVGGVTIYSPTSLFPESFQLIEQLDVPITFGVDPVLLGDPAFAGGYRAQLEIREANTGNVVAVRSSPVPSAALTGHFSWDGLYDDYSRPANGQAFHVAVSLLDAGGAPLLLPDWETTDIQENAIVINVTNITIQADATPAVEMSELTLGTRSVWLPFQVSVAGGAITPVDFNVEVVDAGEVVQGVVHPIFSGSAALWDGTLSAGVWVSIPGEYGLRLLGLDGAGHVLARSNTHWAKVVRIDFAVASPGQVVIGAQTVYPILPAPTMPVLTVQITLAGLSPAAAAAASVQARLEVRYTGLYHDLRLPDVTYVPGPSDSAWDVVAGGVWIPAWWRFCGGYLEIVCRATMQGEVLVGRSTPGVLLILGNNPPKANVRAAYGPVNFQVVGYRESLFTQFSDSPAVPALIPFQPGPLTVLRTIDGGFGVGQLTTPNPTIPQLWNWTENVADSVGRLNAARTVALVYEANGRAADPALPAFTADQLDLEMWARYNGGNFYHVQDAATHSWVPWVTAAVAAAACAASFTDPRCRIHYANQALLLRNNIIAGVFPAGW